MSEPWKWYVAIPIVEVEGLWRRDVERTPLLSLGIPAIAAVAKKLRGSEPVRWVLYSIEARSKARFVIPVATLHAAKLGAQLAVLPFEESLTSGLADQLAAIVGDSPTPTGEVNYVS